MKVFVLVLLLVLPLAFKDIYGQTDSSHFNSEQLVEVVDMISGGKIMNGNSSYNAKKAEPSYSSGKNTVQR